MTKNPNNELLLEKIKDLETALSESRNREILGSLTGGIAHDFNNILAMILGYVELAMDDTPKWNPTSRYLRQIRAAGLRAKEMVQQIHCFSRGEEVEKQPVYLGDFLKESISMIRAIIPPSIDIRTDISSDCKAVPGDETQIHQALRNLCANSVQAMGGYGGILEIRLKGQQVVETDKRFSETIPEGHYSELSVRDTGHGIRTEIMEKIFEPFFTTKGAGKGIGIGLPVVRGIMRNHGGYVLVESEPGKGSTFRLLFPEIDQDLKAKKDILIELPTAG